ncbi:hypothetical protein BDN71DRAFT_1376039, partial [Pleurotus eryngii]
PKIKDMDTYITKWWKWWINPVWHKQSGSEQIMMEGSGSWDTPHITGANSTLSVLVSLWFWREHVSNTSPTFQSWNKAIKDINW